MQNKDQAIEEHHLLLSPSFQTGLLHQHNLFYILKNFSKKINFFINIFFCLVVIEIQIPVLTEVAV